MPLGHSSLSERDVPSLLRDAFPLNPSWLWQIWRMAGTGTFSPVYPADSQTDTRLKRSRNTPCMGRAKSHNGLFCMTVL